MIENRVDGVEAGGVGAVAAQNARSERALQRGETEDCPAIAVDYELDQAVAESADAVVEEDGAGQFGHS